MNIFVTGTDTNAGKTTVAAWICSKIRTTYWKLIQTGDTSDFEIIRRFAPGTKILPEAYRLRAPLSAYDAAKKENIVIDVERFRVNFDKVVIEGAGGIFVPITDNFLMIDAMKCTNSQVVIAVRAKLGIINHILLTVSALKANFIPILGIVICGDLTDDIQLTIEHFSSEKILAVLPESENLQEMFNSIPFPQQILKVLS
ncbi:MAG: dethiobiotin synthase [Opitutales bacterium]|nr:dethiobiotin synthase [Opitutales bacterium]